MRFIVVSLVLSVVLTVLVNLGRRAFPNATAHRARRIDAWMESAVPDDGRRVRVSAPWKAMLVASIVLTILVNLIVRLGR